MRDRIPVIVLSMALAVTLTLTLQDVLRATDREQSARYQMCAVRTDDFSDEYDEPSVCIYVFDENTGELYTTAHNPSSTASKKWYKLDRIPPSE